MALFSVQERTNDAQDRLQRSGKAVLPLDTGGMKCHPCARKIMKNTLLKFFTWWNGQTFGTQFWTWRHGELVGQDETGNRYYRTAGGVIDPALGFERRWVIYNGYAEASKIPPAWHGWMHHIFDTPPTEETYVAKAWEKPHRPNLTGTSQAYRPSGSTLAQGRRPRATGDYRAWTPGGDSPRKS